MIDANHIKNEKQMKIVIYIRDQATFITMMGPVQNKIYIEKKIDMSHTSRLKKVTALVYPSSNS